MPILCNEFDREKRNQSQNIEKQRHGLRFGGQPREILPVFGKVFELVRVDQQQHHHGVEDDRHPEEVQHFSPSAVRNLRRRTVKTFPFGKKNRREKKKILKFFFSKFFFLKFFFFEIFFS